jgi:hypothetical protein
MAKEFAGQQMFANGSRSDDRLIRMTGYPLTVNSNCNYCYCYYSCHMYPLYLSTETVTHAHHCSADVILVVSFRPRCRTGLGMIRAP